MKIKKMLCVFSLMLLPITSAMAVQTVTILNNQNGTVVYNGQVHYNTQRDLTTGVIIINGKTYKYAKCIPRNSTPQEVENMKNTLRYIESNSGSIRINVNPDSLLPCEQ